MTSRTRLWVLAISTPVIAFALIGGFLGQAMARDETYQRLRIFQDVMSLVVDNYVEPVDVKQIMRGAMRGLADGLDPDSAYLTPELVKAFEANTPAGPADIGVDLSRQYYLRIVSARPGSPAEKAGLRSGDYIRTIDTRSTREMSAFEGQRLLQGAPGSRVSLLVIRGNAADPHEVTLTRDRPSSPDLTSRMADGTTGYIRLVEFKSDTGARLRQAIDALTRTGATRFVIDLRGASRGDLDDGLATARLFVKSGTLAVRYEKDRKEPIGARAGDGTIAARAVLLVDQGTAGAAELFAAALDGNDRAPLIGERTLGRAARQRLTHLPDGSGLLLTFQRYLSPKNTEIHEKGLSPEIESPSPEIEFGSAAPATDRGLERAIQYFNGDAAKKAA
jgi:carboxyl-terminal processing protease